MSIATFFYCAIAPHILYREKVTIGIFVIIHESFQQRPSQSGIPIGNFRIPKINFFILRQSQPVQGKIVKTQKSSGTENIVEKSLQYIKDSYRDFFPSRPKSFPIVSGSYAKHFSLLQCISQMTLLSLTSQSFTHDFIHSVSISSRN